MSGITLIRLVYGVKNEDVEKMLAIGKGAVLFWRRYCLMMEIR